MGNGFKGSAGWLFSGGKGNGAGGCRGDSGLVGISGEGVVSGGVVVCG